MMPVAIPPPGSKVLQYPQTFSVYISNFPSQYISISCHTENMLRWLRSLWGSLPCYWIHFHLWSHLFPLFLGKLLKEWSQLFYEFQLTPLCFPLPCFLYWTNPMTTRWLTHHRQFRIFFSPVCYCMWYWWSPSPSWSAIPWFLGDHTLLVCLLSFQPFFQGLFWQLF